MADPNDLEIYKQRYDTFRHLDRLRWQMFQIAVGAAALILGFKGNLSLEWGSWVGVGLLFISLGYAKLRIGSGVVMNSKVLREFGAKIGDANIPEATEKGVSFRIAYVLIAFGIVSFGAAFGDLLRLNGMRASKHVFNAWSIAGVSAVGLGLLLRWILKNSQAKATDKKPSPVEPMAILSSMANVLIAVGCVCVGIAFGASG